jgi:hypothetical protein
MPRSEPVSEPPPQAMPSHARVLVIGGVGSLDWCGIALRRLVRTRKLPYTVDVVPWGLGFGRWYADLTDVANRDAKARLIADKIQLAKAHESTVPVFVVAKSGGSGVAIKALELLDENSIERVVLLAPAVSPTYDLTAALRAVRREIVVFWSPLDLVFLGAGTRVLGTIDRVKTKSAGLVGFRLPSERASEPMPTGGYAKLRQIRWNFRMAASGNFGGHMGPDSPLFLGRYVLPLLTVDQATAP